MLKPVSIAIALTVFAVTGCAAASAVSAADNTDSSEEAPAERLTKYGELELVNVTATPSIDSLTFRGTAKNPYDEPIEGIRLVMQIKSDSTAGSPELGRSQKTIDAKLDPDGHVPFDIEVKIQPAALAEPGFFLRAFAVRRGGEELSAPPMWRE